MFRGSRRGLGLAEGRRGLCRAQPVTIIRLAAAVFYLVARACVVVAETLVVAATALYIQETHYRQLYRIKIY